MRLHFYRHGLVSELAETAVSIPMLQQQLRPRRREDNAEGLCARDPANAARRDGEAIRANRTVHCKLG